VKEELSEHQRVTNNYEFILRLQILYLNLTNSVSYFSVSLFLFTVHISMRAFYADVLSPIFAQTLQTTNAIPFFIDTMDFVYALLVLSFLYFSLNLTYNSKRFRSLIYINSTIMGFFSIFVMVMLLHDIISSGINDNGTCNYNYMQFCSITTFIWFQESTLKQSQLRSGISS
jgi:hypothetical protein